MHLHEYQAKRLFRSFGLPVPDGEVIDSVGLAAAVAAKLGGTAWVVKAQVHAGGRGKGGITFLTVTPLLGMTKVVKYFYPEPSTKARSLTQMTIEDVDHYTEEQRA